MKRTVCLLTAAWMLGAAPAWPEIYRYVAPDGAVRYTDDLSAVPRNQQSRVQVLEALPSAEPPAPEAGDPGAGTDEAETVQQVPDPEKQKLEAEKAMLEKQGQALNVQKRELETRRRQIVESRRVRGNRADDKALRQIKDLDEKIDALRERIQQHNQKVQGFNARVTEYEKRIGAQATP